jgi:hypothetical protein
MRTKTVTVREGENVGPVDWDHPMAKDMPEIWREAEKSPKDFTFHTSDFPERTILQICMYDGWPYWKPTPAILYIGPLNSAEWAHFNSYGVSKNSIRRRSIASHNGDAA